MRVLGVDFGQRRIGLAVSDPTGTLASPWQTLQAATTPGESAAKIALLISEARDAEDPIDAIVVGLPQRLGGGDTDQTAAVRDFARALGETTGLAVHLQDERLTSHEAEIRLAERERDWRRRKARLDAAAAAIILQDYLDWRAR